MKQTTVSIQENFTILSTEMNLFITYKSTLDASCKGKKAGVLTAIRFFTLDQNSIFNLTKAEMFSRFFVLIFTSKKNINFIKRSKMPLSVYFRSLSCPCRPFFIKTTVNHGSEKNRRFNWFTPFSSLFDRVFCKIDIIRPENVYI